MSDTQDKFTEHQRKAGQSKSPKKADAARANLEKAREAKRRAKEIENESN